MSYCFVVVLWYCCIVILFCRVVLSHCFVVLLLCCHIVLSCWWCSYCYLLCCCPLMILFILPNISGHAQVHLALKECLLAELKPMDGTSGITAYGEGYDENLHSLMQTFGEMFGLRQITQNIACTICSCITTRVESFSKLLLQFPESHHEVTPTNCRCTLNSLIKYHFGQEDLPNYDCQYCSRRTLAARHVQISWYPVILCIILGCKMNDDTRITSAVNYPVWDLNLCNFWITWRNSGFKIQPHCHCEPQAK